MKDHCLTCKTPVVYKEVVIVGNGPSGLAMSFLLSGRRPTYNGLKHPEELVTAMLEGLGCGRSLFEADLKRMAQSVEGNGSPVGVLMDKILRPGADQGLELPSLIDWRCHKSLDHVVIGKGPPGGIWQVIDGDTLTLSLSSWMELPGLRFSDCDSIDHHELAEGPKRIKASTVAKYYSEYVKKLGLQKYHRRGEVTSIKPCGNVIDNETDKKVNWKIEGRDLNGRKFCYHSRFVVLATGTYDIPNYLDVPGENLPWVHHKLVSLEKDLASNRNEDPVLIVGAGLSAADAILACRFRQVEVRHVFRKAKTTLEKNNLPSSVYPEYHKVWQMMEVGHDGYPGYSAFPGRRLICFQEEPNGERWARLEDPEGKLEDLKVRLAVVLIGSSANLSYTQKDNLGLHPGRVHSRGNPILVDPSSSEVVGLPNAFALGSLAGDNYVRNITGAAVLAAAHIYKVTTQ